MKVCDDLGCRGLIHREVTPRPSTGKTQAVSDEENDALVLSTSY